MVCGAWGDHSPCAAARRCAPFCREEALTLVLSYQAGTTRPRARGDRPPAREFRLAGQAPRRLHRDHPRVAQTKSRELAWRAGDEECAIVRALRRSAGFPLQAPTFVVSHFPTQPGLGWSESGRRDTPSPLTLPLAQVATQIKGAAAKRTKGHLLSTSPSLRSESVVRRKSGVAPIAARSIGRIKGKLTAVRWRLRRPHRRDTADRVINGHGVREHFSSIRKPPALASHIIHIITVRRIPEPRSASATARDSSQSGASPIPCFDGS